MPSEHREKREFRLGDWLVQPSLGRVSNASTEVLLEPRAMELLLFLADHAGEAVSRQQILDGVWQQEFVSDATVSGIVVKLRKAFGDNARNPRYIETLPKRGYRLLVEPVATLEVVARPGGAFTVGDWLVEPSLNRMSRGVTIVQLDRSTMDVLLCLAERAGEPVPKHELADRVWPTDSVSDLTVRRHIAELQEALGDRDPESSYIETVPERGFRLAAAVATARPSATVTPFPTAETQPEREPYPGLAAFTEADAEHFFGREAETAAMWRRITGHRLLAVIGPSGVGKSSFARAGVIPAAPPGWAHLVCAPGEVPLMALARALLPRLASDADQVEELLSFDDPEVAVAALSRWRQRHDEVLLVVDQFEELFTLNPPETRTRFVDLVLRLVTEARVHVVLVLRDDFLCECHTLPPLAPVYRELTVLGPPAADDLRRALVEPASGREYRFDDDSLPDEMVATVAEERGALPLLAFAARRLWELRDEEQRVLTRAAYGQIGGVGGALAQHAEATLDAVGHDRLPVVRELFRNLITAQATRATRSVDDLLSVFDENEREVADQVLQNLIDARLLTSFEEEADEETGERRVEVVHESLLREWPRLVRWQTQDADAARLRDQLRQAAQQWHTRGRPEELLWTGAPYREFVVWREHYPGGLTATEEAFADAMIRHAARRRRRQQMAMAAALLLAGAVAAVTTTLWQRSEDQARRLEARRLFQIAEQTLASSPPTSLAYALATLELTDGFAQRRLALKAAWRSPMPVVISRYGAHPLAVGADFSPDGRWLAVGHMHEYLALWAEAGGAETGWKPQAEHVRGYFAPDGSTLYTVSTGNPHYTAWSVPDLRRLGAQQFAAGAEPELLNARHGNILRNLRRLVPDPAAPGGWTFDQWARAPVERIDLDRVPAAALAPDGSRLVYAIGETLYLVSVAEPEAEPIELHRCRSQVEHVVFDPGGTRLATAHAGGALRLWTLSGDRLTLLREWPPGSDNMCHDLRFDPSGELLVAGFDDSTATVRAVDEPPGADPLRLRPAGGRVCELAFHPDGRWLAVAGLRRVSLWPLDRARYPVVLRGHSGGVERVAFAPDGTWLGSCSTDGTIRQWPLAATAGAAPRVLYDWGHPVQFWAPEMVMAPDSRFVVATGGEDSARLVPLDGGEPQVLGGFDHWVIRAAVGPQGRKVAVPGMSGGRRVVRLWDLEAGTVSNVVLGDRDVALVNNLQALADGRMLLAREGMLQSVDPATGRTTDLAEGVQDFVASRDGTLVLSRERADGVASVATVHDLVEGSHTPLASHGAGVVSMAFDPTGTVAVTGSRDGIVRVGPVSGSTPHWLVGHRGSVVTVAVSPDGRRIASGGSDGTIRLWPMPDLARPPLHDLPRAELVARLGSLTNLRVVRDPDDPDGYLVRAGPFPGWHTAPEW